MGGKVCATPLRISNDDLQRLQFAGWRALTSDGSDNAANVGSDCPGIIVVQTYIRHSLGLPGALNDRNNLFAVLIGKRNLGAQQVRTSHISAAQILSVAGLAVDAVQGLSSCYSGRIFRRPCFAGVEGARRARFYLSRQCDGSHLLARPEHGSEGHHNRGPRDGHGKIARGHPSKSAAQMQSKIIGQGHNGSRLSAIPENNKQSGTQHVCHHNFSYRPSG
jgi:hypothetical protein